MSEPHSIWFSCYQKGAFAQMLLRVDSDVVSFDFARKLSGLWLAESRRMIRIPAGEFMMGALSHDKSARDHEKPRHLVRITKDFRIGKYPVTQIFYQTIMGKNPSFFKGDILPVEMII